VVPVPGVSALTTALSVSGLPADSFFFKGFLPAKRTQRKNILMELVDSTETIVFFESPKRLMDTLSDMLEILGDRLIVVARELTKIHETILHGKISEVMERLSGSEIKGEVTIVIEGAKTGEKKRLPLNEEALDAALHFITTKNKASVKEAAELLSRLLSLPKKIIYEKAIRLNSIFKSR
jgi:16S rRNA (cytidine1402-2'-O)-methyltransferase